MHTIRLKKQLSQNVFLMKLHAPLVAQERMAGQFIILQLHPDYGERIPLTIADADPAQGTITIIFQEAGKTTHQLAQLNEGDSIPIIVGPLGTPTHIENFGTVICVGGGIGIAPLYPITEALKNAGNTVYSIIGARSHDFLVYEKEMQSVSNELIVCTDDGSYGRSSFVTAPLKELCIEQKPDLVIAIGPAPMMKACCEATLPFNISTQVSLNSIMIDGTGMCGGCRVTVDNKTQFVCIDGPEFDGHLVDWDNMASRLLTFKQHERKSHLCNLEPIVENKLETGRV